VLPFPDGVYLYFSLSYFISEKLSPRISRIFTKIGLSCVVPTMFLYLSLEIILFPFSLIPNVTFWNLYGSPHRFSSYPPLFFKFVACSFTPLYRDTFLLPFFFRSRRPHPLHSPWRTACYGDQPQLMDSLSLPPSDFNFSILPNSPARSLVSWRLLFLA